MWNERYDLVIVGAGPAGLIAAIESAGPSREIVILEKMPRPALKLRISGNGRCNITHHAPRKEFLARFGKNGRFLQHAFAEFSNADLLTYFGKLGVRFKLESGGRYFPEQDRAVEIVDALLSQAAGRNVPVVTRAEVTGIHRRPGGDFSVTVLARTPETTKPPAETTLLAGRVLLATGGKSYPETGSTGAGFAFASRMGHTVTPLSPSLVPLVTRGDTAKNLKGLSLKDVRVTAWSSGRKIGDRFGDMLFTDFGISGPAVLSLSRAVVPCLENRETVTVAIDLNPGLDHPQLDRELLREIEEHRRQQVSSLLKTRVPKRMVPVFLGTLGIPEERPLSGLGAEERRKLKNLLKEFRLEITGHRSFQDAMVTAGGVSVQEIDPRTMESNRVNGLYFAGEIIDIDGDTGGFNLQAAFSTGWLAGRSARQADQEKPAVAPRE
jgi:predicted Rossmann fold flavoprotein